MMIRVRFHGRGGHGVKTASRILGTAAFLAGYECQDSPIYGAERRGAAVTAFTRISDAVILERGTIAAPDLIVVADETLLADASAGVLAGAESASAVFVNAPHPPSLPAASGGRGVVSWWDVTGRTLAVLGRASALSAGLGAAAARLVGRIPEELLRQAVREELASLGVGVEELEKNLQLASEVFGALAAADFRPGAPVTRHEVVPVKDQGLRAGTPMVLAAGNAGQRKTGAWRVERPVVDSSICTRCGLCLVVCPDGTIALDERGYPVIDYDHCKGCLICAAACPVSAVTSIRETQAW